MNYDTFTKDLHQILFRDMEQDKVFTGNDDTEHTCSICGKTYREFDSGCLTRLVKNEPKHSIICRYCLNNRVAITSYYMRNYQANQRNITCKEFNDQIKEEIAWVSGINNNDNVYLVDIIKNAFNLVSGTQINIIHATHDTANFFVTPDKDFNKLYERIHNTVETEIARFNQSHQHMRVSISKIPIRGTKFCTNNEPVVTEDNKELGRSVVKCFRISILHTDIGEYNKENHIYFDNDIKRLVHEDEINTTSMFVCLNSLIPSIDAPFFTEFK